MLLRIVFIAIIFIPFYSSCMSSEKDIMVQQIFNLIYNQQFTEAENVLNRNKNQIDPFYHNILKLDLFWWKYSLSQSKQDAKVLNAVLQEFDNSAQNSRETKINKLISLSYEMRYDIKRYNLVGAFLIRSEVRKQIVLIKKEDLSFLGERRNLFDFYLTLFDYFDESLNPFSFGSKSDKYLQSLSDLEKYSQNDDLILSTMAHYFLGRIYTKVEKQPEKGQEHFKVLSLRFPENPLFKELACGLNTKF